MESKSFKAPKQLVPYRVPKVCGPRMVSDNGVRAKQRSRYARIFRQHPYRFGLAWPGLGLWFGKSPVDTNTQPRGFWAERHTKKYIYICVYKFDAGGPSSSSSYGPKAMAACTMRLMASVGCVGTPRGRELHPSQSSERMYTKTERTNE